MDRKGVRLERPEGFIVVRQIEMEFPNYDLVVPKDFQWSFVISPALLAEMVRRVSISATEEKNFMVTLRLQNNRIQVESGDEEGGLAVDESDVNYDGELIEFSYNFRYLLDALAVFSGTAEIEFRIKDNYAASKIIAAGGNEDLVELVMPIRRTV